MVQVGDPAQLVVVDIQTEETIQAIDLPGQPEPGDGRSYGRHGLSRFLRHGFTLPV